MVGNGRRNALTVELTAAQSGQTCHPGGPESRRRTPAGREKRREGRGRWSRREVGPDPGAGHLHGSSHSVDDGNKLVGPIRDFTLYFTKCGIWYDWRAAIPSRRAGTH